MKKNIFTSVIILMLMLFTVNVIYSQNKNNPQKQLTGKEEYTDEWKKIDNFINKGLPKSAQQIVNTIYNESKQSKNTSQYIKAVLCKMRLSTDYEEEFTVKNIKDLESEIKTATFPAKNILYSILADQYYNYYSNNRYKILDRSQTVNFDQKDIKVWDVRKLLYEIILNYQRSLRNAQELKAFGLDNLDAIIEKGMNSRQFRPTLYDLLAHKAIDFLMNEDYNLTRPADHFEMNNAEYFAPSLQFAKYNIRSKDTLSRDYYAIKLLQDLVEFHLNDANPEALIDVELKRLDFVRSKIKINDKDSIYLYALIKLEKRYIDDSMSAEISYKIGEQYGQSGAKYDPLVSQRFKWDVKTAYQYYENAIKRFPKSYGAQLCRNALIEIRKTSISLTLEEANVPDKPILSMLNHKNLNNVYFKILKIDPEKDKALRDKLNSTQLINSYLLLDVVKEWRTQLSNDGDYQSHRTEIKIPELPLGYYVILASTNKDFTCKEQIVTSNTFWVTNLSYITRRENKGNMDYYVLNRDNGEGIKGVTAKAYTRDYDNSSRTYQNKLWKEFTSDNDGYFEVPVLTSKSYYKYFYFDFNAGNDRYITNNYFSQYAYNTPATINTIATYFFTDRSIYRPGQTIYFKGIVIETSGENKTIVADHAVTVVFNDVNGQKVGELNLRTNDYGSFSGSFTAPTTGLTGRMTISNGTGNCTFNVEEYKRPKFDVSFNPVKGSYKLNEKVIVTGIAKAYAGNILDDAKVKYRVTRKTRFPYYQWWWSYNYSAESVEITSGDCVTDDKGEFKIEFTALADQSIDKNTNPVFDYTINVDVSDINGETHSSSSSVSVGYNALIADINIPSELERKDKSTFTISMTNLNGEPEPAEGEVTIFKLDQPDKAYRDRTWTRPDLFSMNKEEFEKNFRFYNDLYG